MQGHRWAHLAIMAVTLAAVAAPAYAQPGQQRDRDDRYVGDRHHDGDRDRDDRRGSRESYDRGYRDGLHDGDNDGRHSRPFAIRSDGRGHDDDFRRGYEQGYRESYDRAHVVIVQPAPRSVPGLVLNRRLPRGYEEPAFARGYSEGYREGRDDGHDRDRYDPVRHHEYRDGDNGYSRDYGPRDAYKNNYRAGFRQGYEDGYRDGANRRR